MEDQDSKSLTGKVVDWVAAAVDAHDGWAVKRGVYRRGITPDLDPMISWLDRAYRSTGTIPSLEATKDRWTRIPWPKNILAESFALIELEQAYRRHDLILHSRELDRILSDGTTNEAYQFAQSFASTSIKGSTAHGIELTDPSLYVDVDTDVVEVPSWGESMSQRPIHRSDFVLIAARTGVGKSWLLLMAAKDAIQQGWNTVFYSLEMPATDLAKRLKMLLQVDDAPAWVKQQKGRLHVIDQTDTRHGYTAQDLVKRVDQGSRTIIIVDYGELMRPDTGGRTTDGWNKSAEVSQSLQNVAKYVEVPLLAAVQDNRQAVGIKPGVETLSGSDYWGRDADTVLRFRDETGEPPGSGPTRVLDVVKSRHTGGRVPTFFSFEPGATGIRIIDRHEYVAIHARE